MKNKQLYELAKLGISRQNFVKKLKRLLSFSLTMILLAIWIAVSVFGILISMLNKDKTQYIVREESNTSLSEDKIYSDFMKNEKIEYYGIDFTGLNTHFTEEMYLNDKKIIPI